MQEVHQPAAGHGGGGNELLTLDPGMVVWTWLIFFVFLFVLRKYAWKPILDSIEEREASIKKTSEDARAASESLEAATAAQQEAISEGRRTAAATMDAARDAAAEAAEEMRRDAREASERMIADAQDEIGKQKEAAIEALRSEVGDLSVLVASKLLDADLDDDRNRQLVKDYTAALPG